MFIDKDKVEFIDIIKIKNIYNNYRNLNRYLFEPFGYVPVTVYEESLMTDFIYYYIKDNYNDFKLHFNGCSNEKYPKPIFYIFGDNNIINNKVFINKNIQKEIYGALILNILFPFIINKSNIKDLNLNVDNIESIRIFNKMNINYLLDNTFIPNSNFSNCYNDYIFNWYPVDINDVKNTRYLVYLTLFHGLNIDIDNDNIFIYTMHIYNLLHDTLCLYDSIIYQLFKNDFLFYIKYKDSSNLIISNFCTPVNVPVNDYDVISDITILKNNGTIKLNDFIVEFNYYNINNNIEIHDDNIITHDHLFKYNTIVKPWAQKNIYPKINNIYEYRYSGISPIIDLKRSNYKYYLDNVLNIN